MKKLALYIACLCVTGVLLGKIPAAAGGYAPETEPYVIHMPAETGGAEIAAAVAFVVVMIIGIICIHLSKRRDKGADDK